MDDKLFIVDDDPEQSTASSGTEPADAAISLYTIATLQKPETTVDVYDTAIILVQREPVDVKKIALLQSIEGSGVTIKDVTAINGKTVVAVLNNTANSGPLTEQLFLLPPSPSFTSPRQLQAEQICFLALFHHLHFLAVYKSVSGAPSFTDSFKEKYEFIQSSLDTNDMTAFGIDVKDPANKLVSFWDTLQASAPTKLAVYDMIKLIKSGPKEVYKYISGLNESSAAAPSAPSVPSVPSAPSVPSVPSAPSVPSMPSAPSVPSAKPDVTPNVKPDVKPDVKPEEEEEEETNDNANGNNQPSLHPNNNTEADFAKFPIPNGSITHGKKPETGTHILYGKDKVPAEILKVHEGDTPRYNIKKLKPGSEAGHSIFNVSNNDIAPMLNAVNEDNGEQNSNNNNNADSVASEAIQTQPQRGSIKGQNREGRELTQGSHVFYKNDKKTVYKIQSILGTASTPQESRFIMIQHDNGKLIRASSKDITHTEEGLRKSTRTPKPKKGGKRNITRKKNRRL